MMEVPISGNQEIEHTADTALHVWGPDLPALFAEAAIGMKRLMGMRIEEGGTLSRSLVVEALDLESLLVNFLEEILFFGEHENLGFDRFEVEINGEYKLNAKMFGARIVQKSKEIKAVTFHNLNISKTESGYEVIIVFDV